MNFFVSNLNGVFNLLVSAGALTIFYELISNLLTFNHKRKKERAEYLITNLYCLFQDSLEIHLFKNVETRSSFFYTLNELRNFDVHLKQRPKILFYLNDRSRISLDKALTFGERYERSNDIHDLAGFRIAFSSFSKTYFKQINKDRKTVGLPKHGYRYRVFYNMHIYKIFPAFILFIDYYIAPLVLIFFSSVMALLFLSYIVVTILNYF